MNDQSAQDPNANASSYVDDYAPPQDDATLTEDDNSQTSPVIVIEDDDSKGKQSSSDSQEDLESQNIFYMLDVENGDEDLKEKFLDQLQDVIWDDFLNNDVQLLLNQEDVEEFKTHKSKVDEAQGDDKQRAKDELVEFLEKLVPDLEDILLEKALGLKADLFAERINSMKELFQENLEKLDVVNKAEKQMHADEWKSATATLNSIEK